MDLDEWPYPKTPLVPLAESVHERMSVEIFRGCTRGCRFCQAGMITRPVRERSIDGIGEMVRPRPGRDRLRGGRAAVAVAAPTTPRSRPLTKQLADRYAEQKVGLSLPSTRVDAFNIDLANEISRNGRRSGLTFAPEGGSERLRRVINKMVSKEDLIKTVSTAYGNGWRQVKLYFMCGLPTETDDDVLEIAEMAHDVIRAGREAAGHKDIRCTVSIGGFVPKPHTPFQWAAQASPEVVDDRLRKLRAAINANKPSAATSACATTTASRRWSRACSRAATAASARSSSRSGATAAGSTAGPSTSPTPAGSRPAPTVGIDLDWYTTRERDGDEVLPWDHLDSGLDKQWLWDDWQDALSEFEQDDCRWTPCFDCGVCSNLGTDIQIGPTGRALLPLL